MESRALWTDLELYVPAGRKRTVMCALKIFHVFWIRASAGDWNNRPRLDAGVATDMVVGCVRGLKMHTDEAIMRRDWGPEHRDIGKIHSAVSRQLGVEVDGARSAEDVSYGDGNVDERRVVVWDPCGDAARGLDDAWGPRAFGLESRRVGAGLGGPAEVDLCDWCSRHVA